ncbi:MAG: hypothetical protein RA161_00135 [Arsenophonus sp.]|nr:MAG: hypothetical protein RA161_00135 [Arsenophonus sp.]
MWGKYNLFFISIITIYQIIVHFIYFLDINLDVENRLHLFSFIFAISIAMILIFGSLWIMYHLNYNMILDHSSN